MFGVWCRATLKTSDAQRSVPLPVSEAPDLGGLGRGSPKFLDLEISESDFWDALSLHQIQPRIAAAEVDKSCHPMCNKGRLPGMTIIAKKRLPVAVSPA